MQNLVQSHKDLIVWQKSMDLVEDIYNLTKIFPKEEMYGLISQMRRACTAIPTNITEGYQRNHTKEYIQFLYIAKSSAAELETLLNIALRLSLVEKSQINKIETNLVEILKMLNILVKKLKFKAIPMP